MNVETQQSALQGLSYMAGVVADGCGKPFHAYHAADGCALENTFYSATVDIVNRAVDAARDAFTIFAATSGQEHGCLLGTTHAARDDKQLGVTTTGNIL